MLASWGEIVCFLRVSALEVYSCSVGCPILMHIQAMLSRLSGFKRREYMGLEGKSDGRDRGEHGVEEMGGGFDQNTILYVCIKF